jgi:hypothetical protein
MDEVDADGSFRLTAGRIHPVPGGRLTEQLELAIG